MSSVVDLIVLANSAKKNERCIAGIDRSTGDWVRPVGPRGDGEVCFSLRNVNGKEPQVLDVVRMELGDSAETHGFQLENRTIVARPWQLVGRAEVDDILRFRCGERYVFFDGNDRIRHADLTDKIACRSSLQLWETWNFQCFEDTNSRGTKRWKGRFSIIGGRTMSLVIKDVEYEKRLKQNHQPSEHALILVSLGVPFTPDTLTEPHC